MRRSRSGEPRGPASPSAAIRLPAQAGRGAHSLWINSVTGAVEAVPRHTEISNRLAQKICRSSSMPEIGGEH